MNGLEILDIKQFPEGFFMQHHMPKVMLENHSHNHVEILLPVGCDLIYQTQMGPAIAKDRQVSVFWGQIPHRLSQIDRTGELYIANLLCQNCYIGRCSTIFCLLCLQVR